MPYNLLAAIESTRAVPAALRHNDQRRVKLRVSRLACSAEGRLAEHSRRRDTGSRDCRCGRRCGCQGSQAVGAGLGVADDVHLIPGHRHAILICMPCAHHHVCPPHPPFVHALCCLHCLQGEKASRRVLVETSAQLHMQSHPCRGHKYVPMTPIFTSRRRQCGGRRPTPQGLPGRHAGSRGNRT